MGNLMAIVKFFGTAVLVLGLIFLVLLVMDWNYKRTRRQKPDPMSEAHAVAEDEKKEEDGNHIS